MQDDRGRDVMLLGQSNAALVLPVDGATAVPTGPVVNLTADLTGGSRSLAGALYVAAPRGGTPPGRYVDLVVDASGPAHELWYARIQLY
jgi:hypothetical protein